MRDERDLRTTAPRHGGSTPEPGASQEAIRTASRTLGLDRSIEPPPTWSTESVSLPPGGGALRSIAEKFAANPATGTGSISLPLPLPDARGLVPPLALRYDSGAGAGPFGLGWSLPLGRIQRKTDKGLPQYRDSVDSDTFVLSDAEDLVPWLVETSPGTWERDAFAATDEQARPHTVLRYRPRVDSAFSRIERWTRDSDGVVHWRTRDRGNVLRLYGVSEESRIADPERPSKVFAWLLCEVIDDRGSRILVDYLADDASALSSTATWDRARRTGLAPFVQRYVRTVRYGNATPHGPGDAARDFLFAVAFDYGDTGTPDLLDRTDPVAQTAAHAVPDLAFSGSVPERPDPFSTRRAGFEVRTRFRCSRIALFHGVDDRDAPTDAVPLDAGQPLAISVWELGYEEGYPSRLASVTQLGFRTEGGGVSSLAVPPVALGYQPAEVSVQIETLGAADISALPRGEDSRRLRWHDLDGEGLVGILTERGGAWWYRRNHGEPSRWARPSSRARLGPRREVSPRPTLPALSRGAVFADVDGDGRAELVARGGPRPGSQKRRDDGWAPFRAFESVPNVDWSDPGLRFVDLTGDGRADLLLTEHDVVRWWPSRGADGYGPGRRVPQALDEARAPRALFGDRRSAVFLADMTGDGLSDLVRVRNSQVCYWPNLGYGRFGAKITLGAAPMLDRSDDFDPARVRLVDIDGSGPADLLYLGRRKVTLCVNEGGNRLADPVQVRFPPVRDPSLVDVVDLLGDGTQCLVQRPEPSGGHELRFVRLMAQGKPHLLTRVDNGQGGETRLSYVPSTKFYVDDRDAGRPWATKLPFPVQVLERVEVRDHLREHRHVQRYAYHHGFYDGVEREFRGFGMVEQWDTERFFDLETAPWFDEAASAGDDFVAPVVSRTWFHTGAWFEEKTLTEAYAAEYWSGDPQAASLPGPSVQNEATLTPAERREAHRAMKGAMLRQELWDAEESPAAPYLVTQTTIEVVPLQPATEGAQAGFRVDSLGSHTAAYDRQPDDPRVTQSAVLERDGYGTPLLSAQITFGRRASGDFEAITLSEQQQTHVVFTAAEVVHDDSAPERLRLALPIRQRAFELVDPAVPSSPERYAAAELLAAWTGGTKTPYGAPTSPGDLSQLGEQLVRYVDEATLGGSQAALTEGQVGPHALVQEVLTLALTDEVLATLDAAAGWSGPSGRRATLQDEGGYLVGEVMETAGRLSGFDASGADAWASSGVTVYGASGEFFRPEQQVDPFGRATTTLTWDAASLVVTSATTAFGAGVPHSVSALLDPQTRTPWQVTDLNGLVRQVRFDALGRVAKTRLVGDDPASPRDTWDQPTTQTDYVFAVYDAPSGSWTPGYAHTYARKEHGDVDPSTDPVDPSNPAYQQARTWFDGLGRELMTKAQAAPDAASPTTPRFVGTGRVVLNNKELPVKQYEPFFSDTWDFETDAAMTGVTPELHYDPLGRLVRVDLPDGTQRLIQHSPWRTRSWDGADSLPAGGSGNAWYDAPASANAWELPGGPSLTAAERSQLQAAVAAAKGASLAHRDTPTVGHLDSLGRPFLEQRAMSPTTDQAGRHTVTTDVRATYDLLGRVVAVDAEYRVSDGASGLMTHAQPATATVFDLLGRPLKSVGRDEQTFGQTGTTGTRYALPALDGQVARSWDSRGNSFRHTFDGLRRPASTYVDDGSDQYLHTHVVYGADFDVVGETPEEHRLLGRPWKVFDASGELRTDEVDDDGNVTGQRRWFVAGYRNLPDWSGVTDGVTPLPAYVLDPRSPVDPEVFMTTATFDALGRPKTEVLYRGTRTTEDSTRAYSYDAGGRLLSVVASAAGQPDEAVVRSITYDARGHRLVVTKGTKTGTTDTPSLTTTHVYDPNTFRLLRMRTVRDRPSGTDVLQDLRYVHDALGNITLRVDGAQDTVYFDNAAVTAEQTYAYDALDRLVDARGREHTGTFHEPEGGFGVRRQKNVPYGRGPNAHRGDGTALRRYTQVFSYDAVGNLAEVVHHQGNLGPVLSRRTYRYTDDAGTVVDAEAAEPFAPLFNNQLASTVVGSSTYAHGHDAHGNMDLRHLVAQSWSPLDRLHSIQATAAWSSDGDSPTALSPTENHDWFYVYAADGQRARKVRAVGTTGAERSQERFYLGAFEVWREYDTNATATSAGVPETERETWHVSDDTGRMAMVETKTWASGSVVSTPVPRWRLQLDDHLGTATGEVTEAGAVISYEEFHPYGTTAFQAVDASIDVSRKRYRYTGMERDDETGLQYHHHRYYAPWLGRWTRPDPAGLVDGVNRWGYVVGAPLSSTDSRGLQQDEVDAINKQVQDARKLREGVERSRETRGDSADVFESIGLTRDEVRTIAHGQAGYAKPRLDELKARYFSVRDELRALGQLGTLGDLNEVVDFYWVWERTGAKPDSEAFAGPGEHTIRSSRGADAENWLALAGLVLEGLEQRGISIQQARERVAEVEAFRSELPPEWRAQRGQSEGLDYFLDVMSDPSNWQMLVAAMNDPDQQRILTTTDSMVHMMRLGDVAEWSQAHPSIAPTAGGLQGGRGHRPLSADAFAGHGSAYALYQHLRFEYAAWGRLNAHQQDLLGLSSGPSDAEGTDRTIPLWLRMGFR